MQVLDDANSLIVSGQILGRSPRDGAELEPVAAASRDAITTAVAEARKAQAVWARVSPAERAKRIKKLGPRMLARAPALAELMAVEHGKSGPEAYTSEIIPSADLFKYWAKEAPRLLMPEVQSLNPINFPKKAGIMELRPKGVVGLISPWNFPLSLPLRTLVPALCAGNAVVFKPSEYAPRVGDAIGELFAELEVPNLVSVVQGGPEAGAALIEAEVDYVVFTGSVQSGRKVAAACADRLIPYSLELGGKDPAIVLADANLDRAADGIVWACFFNAGQNCASVERVYVVESVAQAFIDKVIARTEALTIGGGDSSTFDIGPLVRPAGLKTVEQHVADALEHGATLRCGGKATGVGGHYEPTVLTDVNEDMAVMTAETFGPVMPIAVVQDEAEAIRRANQSVFGLTASIWTRDLRRGRELADQIHAGVVTLNNHAFTGAVPHAPWHGAGQSGGGVTNSKYAFIEMCQPHYTLIDRAKAKELHWFPHNGALLAIVRGLAALTSSGGGKLAALWQVLKSFPKRWKS